MNKLGTLTVPYGGKTKYEGFHPGVDVANKEGTPVPAMSSGTVTGISSGHQQGDNGFGNSVVIQDKNGLRHKYSHLSNVGVKLGQNIQSGQEVGPMGKTGSVYSPSGGDPSHLDYRIVNAYGKYVNPYPIIKRNI